MRAAEWMTIAAAFFSFSFIDPCIARTQACTRGKRRASSYNSSTRQRRRCFTLFEDVQGKKKRKKNTNTQVGKDATNSTSSSQYTYHHAARVVQLLSLQLGLSFQIAVHTLCSTSAGRPALRVPYVYICVRRNRQTLSTCFTPLRYDQVDL